MKRKEKRNRGAATKKEKWQPPQQYPYNKRPEKKRKEKIRIKVSIDI